MTSRTDVQELSSRHHDDAHDNTEDHHEEQQDKDQAGEAIMFSDILSQVTRVMDL